MRGRPHRMMLGGAPSHAYAKQLIDASLVVIDAADAVGNPASNLPNSGTGGTSYDCDVTVAGTPTPGMNGSLAYVRFQADALETSSGVEIPTPYTAYAVYQFLDTDGLQFVISSNSGGNALDLGLSNGAPSFRINAGVTKVVDTADTELRQHTIQMNADSTSKYSVGGIGSVTGDIGAETWDFGTIGAFNNGTSPADVDFYLLIIRSGADSESDIAAIQNYLRAFYGVP